MTDRHTVDVVLETAAAHAGYPATPDVVDAVLARIERLHPATSPVPDAVGSVSGRPAPRERARRRSLRRRSVAAAVAVTVAGVIAVGTMLGAHHAVADWLGIGAVRIETVPIPADVDGWLDLGDPVTLVEAVGAASVELLAPEALGDPDLVLLDDAGQVSLVYGVPAGTGAGVAGVDPAADTGVGTLVTFLDGDLGPSLTKLVDTGLTSITQVDVGGAEGLWLEGGPHLVTRTDGTGIDHLVGGRLAANTLIWVRDDTTIRIETTVDLPSALAIADSLRPAG